MTYKSGNYQLHDDTKSGGTIYTKENLASCDKQDAVSACDSMSNFNGSNFEDAALGNEKLIALCK